MARDSDCAMLGPPPTSYQIMMAEQDIIDGRRADAWYEEKRRKMACRWCGTRGGEFCSSKCRQRWMAEEGP